MRDHQRFELIEFRFDRVDSSKLQHPFEVVDTGPEGAVHVVGRTLESQCLRALRFQPFGQRAQDAAFSNAGFPRQEHHLTFTVLRQRPPIEQQSELLLAANERRQSAHRGRLESAEGATSPANLIGAHGSVDAAQPLLSQILIIERSAGQTPHLFANHDGTGSGNTLQSVGDIDRSADRPLVDRGHNDQPGGNTNPHRQLPGSWVLQLAQRIEDRQAGMDGTLTLVLVCDRETEEGDRAVAAALMHRALVARDARRANGVVRLYDFPKLLGIETGCQIIESRDLARHHGQLPTLAPEGRCSIRVAANRCRRVGMLV